MPDILSFIGCHVLKHLHVGRNHDLDSYHKFFNFCRIKYFVVSCTTRQMKRPLKRSNKLSGLTSILITPSNVIPRSDKVWSQRHEALFNCTCSPSKRKLPSWYHSWARRSSPHWLLHLVPTHLYQCMILQVHPFQLFSLSARNISPVEMCATWNSSTILAAWVPLPAPGNPIIKRFMMNFPLFCF